MNEENNFRLNQASFMTLKSDSSISSFKPSDLDDGYFYPNDSQEFSLVNRKSSLPKPRKYPIPQKSPKRHLGHRSSMSTEKLSANIKNFCSSCAKHLETIENLKKDQERSAEKYFMTEKHLKQYDNLLQIKDKRLQQDEATIKADFELLEKEKENLRLEQIKLENEKSEILIQKEEIRLNKLKLNEKQNSFIDKSREIEQINQVIREKDKELIKITIENEDLKRKLFEQVQINNEQVLKMKLLEPKIIVENLPDIEKFKKKLNEKKEELKIMQIELIKLQNELQEKKNEIFQQNQNLEEIYGKLENDKKIVEEAKKQVFDEYESIEELKQILKIQEDNLQRERELMQEKYEEKVADVEELKQKLSDNLKKIIEEKEFFTSETQEKLDLEIKLNRLTENQLKLTQENIEISSSNSLLTQEISTLQSKITELEDSIKQNKKSFPLPDIPNKNIQEIINLLNNELNQNINQDNFLETIQNLIVEYKQTVDQLKLLNNSTSLNESKNEKIYQKLEKKLKKLKIKENDLNELQKSLNEERKSVDLAAEYVKNINDDLSVKEKLLNHEKDEFKKKILKIVDIAKGNDEVLRIIGTVDETFAGLFGESWNNKY